MDSMNNTRTIYVTYLKEPLPFYVLLTEKIKTNVAETVLQINNKELVNTALRDCPAQSD